MEKQELIYSRGQLSAEQLEQEIARFWSDLDTSSDLQEELAATGIDTAALHDMDSADAISVRVDSSGVDPVSVSLIIMFAPTYNKVLKDVWATVLLPRIRRRWGDDAIGDETSRS